MGLMDKAKKAMKGRSGMVEKGIDTAVTQADKRTKGKYGDKLRTRAEDLKDRARQLDEDRPAGDPGPGGNPGGAGPAGPGTGPAGGTEPPAGGGGVPPR